MLRRRVAGSLAAAILAGVPGVGWAQGVGGIDGLDGALLAPPPGPAKAPLQPFSAALGVLLDDPRVPGIVVAQAVNNQGELALDAAAPQVDKSLRIGVPRPIGITGNSGLWLDAPGGARVWVVEAVSFDAVALRLHFQDLDLPEGAELIVYSPEHPERVHGVYGSRGPVGTGEFWSPSTFGQRARVEVRFPRGAAPADPARVGFVVDSAMHMYRDVMGLLGAPIADRGADGCEDVTCHAAWANTARSVGAMVFISTSARYCSGQLMNSVNGDLTPYFLSANHCLSTAGDAANTEVFWLFQTPTCNGTASALNTLQHSPVATLLSTGTASDFTLLMLEGTVPRDMWWSGWQFGAVANGTAVVGIGHPRGSWKRIAFGTTRAAAACGTGGGHLNADWTGVSGTEPGASGGGLFLTSNQRLVGQLHCGPSACDNPSDDDYGAFDTTHGVISGFLAGGTDDGLENNDLCTTPRALADGFYNNLILKSTDEDWYSVHLETGRRVTFSIGFTHANGDIDAELWDGCGSVVTSSGGTGNAETFSYTNTGAPRDFHLRVFLFNDTRNAYTLSVQRTFVAPPNDACAAATAVGPGSYTGTLNGATNDGAATCGTSATNPDTWYAFTAPAAGTLTVSTCGTHDGPGADLGVDTVLSVLTTCGGAEVVCNDDGVGDPCGAADNGVIRDSFATASLAAGQRVLIRVSKFDTTGTGPFSLQVGFRPVNDACAAATNVSAGGSYPGTLQGATADGGATCGSSAGNPDVWYTFTAPAAGALLLTTCGTHDAPGVDAGVDTVISLHTACTGTIANESACNDDAQAGECSGSDTGLPRDSALAAALAAGQTVAIRVTRFSTGVLGPFTLRVSFVPAGAGGACCTGTSCVLVIDAPACAGAYQGNSTACSPDPTNPTTCCRANFDRLNGVGVADIFSFLASWFAGDPAADFDGSGLPVRVADIFAFLSAWFAGC